MKNTFLFTGEETYLLQEQAQRWKQAFLEKHGEFNLVELDAEGVSVSEIQMQVEAQPFLGDKRLIFIDNFPPSAKVKKGKKSDTKKDKVEDQWVSLMEGVPAESVVVFIQPKPDKRKKLYKQLVKNAEVKTFDPLVDVALEKWVQQQFSQLNQAVDLPVVRRLIALVGPNLWRLSQEVNKLALLPNGITLDQVNELVSPSVEANIFHFTDALGAKQPKKALWHLHQSMASGDSLTQLFYMVIRQFRLFIQVLSYLEENPQSKGVELAKVLGLHPFVVKNITRQVRQFNLDQLKEAYQSLLQIDHQLKTSQIKISTDHQLELALAIETFILKFCR